MLKKFLVLFILPIFLLTGCSFKRQTEEITFSSWGSVTEVQIIKNIISEFEKENPDIKVTFLHVPQNYFPKLHLLFASNTAPDVIFINNLNLPLYTSHLEDLSNKINTEDYFSKSLDGMSYNGKLYAVPRDVSNLVFYINKDLLRNNNIPFPQENWTLDDLLQVAQKVTNSKTFGISYEKDLFWALPYINYYGGGILDNNAEKILIETAESQKGLQFYKNLRDKYHIAPSDSDIGSSTLAQMFLSQKIAIYLSGRWLYPKISEQAKFNWSVLNFPYGSKGVPCDVSGWAISKNSKHKKAAITFLKYISNKKNGMYFAKTGLIVPANKDCAKLLNNPEHNEQIFLKVIDKSAKTPVNKEYKKITDKLNLKYNL